MTQTLLKALSSLFPDSSQRTLRSWLDHGAIYVNGVSQSRANHAVSSTDEIKKHPPIKSIGEGVDIVFEDEHIVVVEKPQQLLSVNLDKGGALSVHGLLKKYYDATIYPVHRLDRETSGLLLFAKTKDIQQKMKTLWMQKNVERSYLALISSVDCSSKGTITTHLRESKSLDVFVCSPTHEDGKQAITHYTLLKKGKKNSLYKFILETGKKHQIRVHCSFSLAPIVGDTRYGADEKVKCRVCLHSHTLVFSHPVTERKISLLSPLPNSIKLHL